MVITFSTETPPRGQEARRLWIAEEADSLCLPAFLTPRWQSLYSKKDEARWPKP